MKKILIVLALAAASGSAMAWTESGLGGNVELGGGLNLVDNVTPWEVKVGDAQTGLDMDIQKGKKTAGIEVKTSIPILGIRTKEKSLFTGQSGFSPQIDFGGTVDLDKAKNGVSTLTLAVKGIDDNKIGILTAPLTTVGIGYSIDSSKNYSLFSPSSEKGFFGGVPTVRTNVLHIELSQIYANMLIPGISDNFLNEGFPVRGVDAADFTSSEFEGSAYYASGIASGSKIKIELNSPMSESTNWKASLPITVTYI